MSMRVLVVGEPRHVSILLGDAVSNEEWDLHCVPDLERALEKCRERRPDLLLLDLPLGDGGVRKWIRLWEERGEGEPLPALPLHSRNRITGLPAMAELESEMERHMDYGEDFCFLYANLNHFRGYNKVHGFAAGDQLLGELGGLIGEACAEAEAFPGHLAGDQFVMLCPLDRGQDLAEAIMERFAGLQARLYRSEEHTRGFVSHLDRQGKVEEIPILGLTLCVIPKVAGNFSHLGEIWNSVAELRGYARKQGGSFIALERRYTPADFWRQEKDGRQGSGTDGL